MGRGERGVMMNVPDETESLSGVRCPGCGGELLVSSVQDSFDLLCRRGHQVKVEDLLGSHASDLTSVLEPLLHAWEAKLESLKNLSVSARINGLASMSEVFDKHIHKLESRIELLRSAAKPPSARLLPPGT